MENNFRRPPDRDNKIGFDWHINLGHVLTVFAIFSAAAVGALQVKTDVAWLNKENASRKTEISDLKLQEAADKLLLEDRITGVQNGIHQELIQLHNDLSIGFLHLDDKLDRKADKKGM
jgi:hypothetical protein